ncbi:MAG: TlyA family RNA methyltransferase [Verrucomicrobiales bacterium]|nr:TlyA family RNA methyltransferase [Verrucomicrobiales bacterium]
MVPTLLLMLAKGAVENPAERYMIPRLMAKERLDQLIVSRGLSDSREQARRLVIAGEVRVEGFDGILKPGQKLPDDVEIILKSKPKFVGRGGFKIEKGLDHFGIDPAGLIALDAGASTGGFTDCLLQRGAEKVYAYDVGKNQLAWKLRSDPRVVSREGFNIRHMTPDDLPEKVDLVVIDVSFISLTLILPPVFEVLKPEGSVICLIKPQFELKREQVGKGGVVRDSKLHDEAVAKIKDFVENVIEKSWQGLTVSPISGGDGNVEFLAWLQNKECD